MRRDSKKGKCMHSLSVSVCPCLSENVCARTFWIWLHCFDILSCPELRLKTASSSSWGDSPMSFFSLKCLCQNRFIVHFTHCIDPRTFYKLHRSTDDLHISMRAPIFYLAATVRRPTYAACLRKNGSYPCHVL